jgi:preprotein translocase subunit SecY
MGILTTLRNAWKIADLRKKILFTLMIIVLFRIGSSIPVPFLDASAISSYFNSGNTILGYMNMLSGNALSVGTLFALTIQPYINASIIIQLLTVAIPYFERLAKDDSAEKKGRKKLNKITRYTTIAIALLQGFGYFQILRTAGAITVVDASKFSWELFLVGACIVLTLTAGSSMVQWLGESIDEKGIGNGISMILFASIVSRAPDLLTYVISAFSKGGKWWLAIIVLILAVAMFGLIVFMDSAERRITIQYAKRQVGRKVYGGQKQQLPIKVCMTGVMPIIFAFAITSLPATIAAFLPSDNWFAVWTTKYFGQTSIAYMLISFALIIAFNYFYIAIQYNASDIAKQLRENGGTIPGIRPGRPTVDFIMNTVNKITLFGAIYLGVIAIFPYILQKAFPADLSSIALGGTSMMILVSVALETVKVLEAQMIQRNMPSVLD